MAIDLSWDIIARFTSFNMPKAFYDDFVKVAEDEARVIIPDIKLYYLYPRIK